MAGESPAAVIVDGVNGIEIAVEDAIALPALTRALLVAGIDAGNVARFLRLTTGGSALVAVAQPAAAVVSAVVQVASSTTLLASNAARIGATIYNNASVPLYFKLGASASLVDFTVRMPAHASYELPFPAYTGLITGLWPAAGGGTAQVTETS